MSKHTQGPWIITEDDNSSDVQITTNKRLRGSIVDIANMDIHYTAAIGVEQEANAKLIAAAPELLEALEGLERCIMETRGTDAYAALEAARSAIAKAKGGNE